MGSRGGDVPVGRTAHELEGLERFGRQLIAVVEEHKALEKGSLDADSLIQAALRLQGLDAERRPASSQPGALLFLHTCRYTACTGMDCALCRHNPHKACAVQLRPKYVVGQEVSSPCGANLRVAMAPPGGVAPPPPGSAAAQQQWEALRGSGTRLQLLLVDERARQQRTKDLLMSGASGTSNMQVAALLRQTTVHFDPAGNAMLACAGATPSPDGSLMLDLAEGGGCNVEGLSVGCSTERATAGRKRAPVRLAALLVDSQGQPLDAAPTLSPEFYVVSDRAENHEGMGGTLYMDSPAGHVRTIGKETQRRLADLPAACEMVGTRLRLPEGLTSVLTVRQLGQLLQATMPSQTTALSQVLKISKAQLESAAAHVATAVEPDSWLRAYVSPAGATLLFNCRQGGCDCAAPAAVLRCEQAPNGELTVFGLQRLEAADAPLLRREGPLRTLYQLAEAAWAAPRHEGWVILQVAGKRYQTVEELEAAVAEEVRGQPVLEQLQEGLVAGAAAPAAHLQAAPPPPHPSPLSQQQQQEPAQPNGTAEAVVKQASPKTAAVAAAQAGTSEVQVLRKPAMTLAGNTAALATAASGGTSLSTATASDAQKRPFSSISADDAQPLPPQQQPQQPQQVEWVVKQRSPPAPSRQQPAEHGPPHIAQGRRSLGSLASQQDNASQGGHMAALAALPLPQSLQPQPAPLHSQQQPRPPLVQAQPVQAQPQLHQPQWPQQPLPQQAPQQAQLLAQIVSAIPGASYQSPSQQDQQQQADVLQLLCRLTEAHAAAAAPAPPPAPSAFYQPAPAQPPSAFTATNPSMGDGAATSMRLLQGLLGAAAAPAGSSAVHSAEPALQSPPADWAPALAQLAQLLGRQ